MKKLVISLVLSSIAGSVWPQTATETGQLSQWSRWGITSAWNRGFTGLRSSIAIIDNGIDTTHTDFTGKIINSKNFVRASPVTWGSHGTQMAGIAAAAQNGSGTVGVAPGAGIMFAQVGSGGLTNSISDAAVNSALLWASAQNATVINMSFGSPKFAATYNSVSQVYFAPGAAAYDKQGAGTDISYFQTAAARGSILVFAAGNDSQAYPTFPGNYVSRTSNGQLVLGGRAIVVGAVDQNNQIAGFSNRAGHVCQTASGTKCLDVIRTRDYFLVAPGVNIAAPQPNPISAVRNSAVLVSGTSAAAAYASGGIAVIKQAWPALRPEQLVGILLNTARDLGAPGTDDVYGRGLIDLDRATSPIGALAVATPTTKLGISSTSRTGPSLSTTGISGTVGQQFKTSSILKQTQVLDEYGRNYVADLTQTIGNKNYFYDFASPFMSDQGYVPISWKWDELQFITRIAAQSSGIEVTRNYSNFELGYQIGSNSELNGFLGNYGYGAMNMGRSSTFWQVFSVGLAINDTTKLRASYGLANTQLTRDVTSMVEFTESIKSDTVQIGIVKSNTFLSNDQLALGLGTMPRITSGQAKLSVVTDYTYRETASGDIIADPVISKETVDLKQKITPVIYLGYATLLNKTTRVSSSLTANQDGYKLGVMFTWIQ